MYQLGGVFIQKLASTITQLEDTKKLLDTRSELNTQLEGIENRIRELKTIIEDQMIEKKVCFVHQNQMQKYELQLKRQEEEAEDLRKKVAASSDSSSELLQNLSGEYEELKKQLEEVEKEEMETEQLLTSAQMEVGNEVMGDEQEQRKVKEYKKRMEVRVELMQQLIDRVHSYQVSVMQAFPKQNCFLNKQELIIKSKTIVGISNLCWYRYIIFFLYFLLVSHKLQAMNMINGTSLNRLDSIDKAIPHRTI